MPIRGEAVKRVEQLGRRYAIGIRAVTLVPIAVVAIASADTPAIRNAAIVLVCVLTAWSVVYAFLLERNAGIVAGVIDAVLLCGVGLLTAQLTSPSWLESSRSWIRPFVMFAAVGYQYSTPWRAGVPLGLLVCTTTALATVAAGGQPMGPDVIVTAVWSNLVPMLARLLFSLLTQAARRADATVADADAVRQEQAVAERVRAEHRDISDSLHDTAATTLLMVAMGQVRGLGPLLRERARHDLDTIRAVRAGDRAEADDLGDALAAVAARAPIVVVIAPPPDSVRLPPLVVRALADAAGEALTNVARHAGTAEADLRFDRRGATTVVEIVDRGHGFVPGRVPATRRGIRGSITERVESVGGNAAVESAPGAGTTVRLEWPR